MPYALGYDMGAVGVNPDLCVCSLGHYERALGWLPRVRIPGACRPGVGFGRAGCEPWVGFALGVMAGRA